MAKQQANRQVRTTGIATGGISASELLKGSEFNKSISELNEDDVEELARQAGFSKRDTRRAIKGFRNFQKLDDADIKFNPYGTKFNTVFGETTPADVSGKKTGMREGVSPANLLGLGRNVNYFAGAIKGLIDKGKGNAQQTIGDTYQPKMMQAPSLTIPQLQGMRTNNEAPPTQEVSAETSLPPTIKVPDLLKRPEFSYNVNWMIPPNKTKDLFMQKAVLPAIGAGIGGTQYRSLSDPNFGKGPNMEFSQAHYDEMMKLKAKYPNVSDEEIVDMAFKNLSDERLGEIAINTALAFAGPVAGKIASATLPKFSKFSRFIPKKFKNLFTTAPKSTTPAADISRQEALEQAAARMAEESGEMGARVLKTPNIPKSLSDLPNININRNALSKLSKDKLKKFNDAISWENNSWRWRKDLTPQQQADLITDMKKYGVMRQGGTLPKYQSKEFGTNVLPGSRKPEDLVNEFRWGLKAYLPPYGSPTNPNNAGLNYSSNLGEFKGLNYGTPYGNFQLNQRNQQIPDYTPAAGWGEPEQVSADEQKMFNEAVGRGRKQLKGENPDVEGGYLRRIFGGNGQKGSGLANVLETAAVGLGPALLSGIGKMKSPKIAEQRPVELAIATPQSLRRDYTLMSDIPNVATSDARENMMRKMAINAQNQNTANAFNIRNAEQLLKSQQDTSDINRQRMLNAQMQFQRSMAQADNDLRANYMNTQNRQAAIQAGFGNIADRWKNARYADVASDEMMRKIGIMYPGLQKFENPAPAQQKPAPSRRGGKLEVKSLLKRKK